MTAGPLDFPPRAAVPGSEVGPGVEEPWWVPPDHEPSDEELHGAWPDPFAGPPDLQTWLLRQVEPDEAEYMGAENIGAEVSAGGESAECFAVGGSAEAINPGPVLAALSQEAVNVGLDGLPDEELIG